MRDPRVEVCTLPVELSSSRARVVAAAIAAARLEQTASASVIRGMVARDFSLVLAPTGWKQSAQVSDIGRGF